MANKRSRKSPRELRRWKKRLARQVRQNEAIDYERTMGMLGGPEGFAAISAAPRAETEDPREP